MVEVDVQLTKDGRAVVFHGDVLADGTCINTLTLRELRKAGGERIPMLKKILKRARRFTFRQDGPSGIIDIEIKASLPNCDPNDVFDSMLVDAVVFDVAQADMIDQALIESCSPAVVALAVETAPEIARGLSVLSVQFLTSKQFSSTKTQDLVSNGRRSVGYFACLDMIPSNNLRELPWLWTRR
jgi:glycerophosphoryl diester phosphodiesterase